VVNALLSLLSLCTNIKATSNERLFDRALSSTAAGHHPLLYVRRGSSRELILLMKLRRRDYK